MKKFFSIFTALISIAAIGSVSTIDSKAEDFSKIPLGFSYDQDGCVVYDDPSLMVMPPAVDSKIETTANKINLKPVPATTIYTVETVSIVSAPETAPEIATTTATTTTSTVKETTTTTSTTKETTLTTKETTTTTTKIVTENFNSTNVKIEVTKDDTTLTINGDESFVEALINRIVTFFVS